MKNNTRTNARTLAIQALYDQEINGSATTPEELVTDILKFSGNNNADKKFLKTLIEGALENSKSFDEIISKYLSGGWNIEKLNPLMRVILRVATYELQALANVPPKVVIKEYMELTKKFVGEKEVRFTNGVLDKIAKELRPQAFANG